jgi:hypothetical protein
MTEKLSLLFRAQIIANNTKNMPHGTRYKRIVAIALRELNEAVDQALQDYAEMMK